MGGTLLGQREGEIFEKHREAILSFYIGNQTKATTFLDLVGEFSVLFRYVEDWTSPCNENAPGNEDDGKFVLGETGVESPVRYRRRASGVEELRGWTFSGRGHE